ncbi:carbohydrate binding family 9 domain-containing protein [Salegentibacter sp. JZCK2]|uniref:DUF5916 domain-containing protein n=1 Tax=Salegentibacter tibetensis TaxID=2873600 RepID=UPI001CCE84A3|nr:DUF5916 domain-containing protein [Salegentibacter tibetensis]MBZ9729567.1 carbohydrate binding family 9 domain-containing protein [Salegentibacter tibetensis]
MKQFLSLFLVCLLPACLISQNKEFHVNYINTPISIDGILDEPAWDQAEPATNFWQYFPSDKVQAKNQSEIRMLYNENMLYVGIKVYVQGDNFIIPSLRRDFRAGGSDNITLMFDTFNDGANAFLFGVNPAGVRREALVSGGGTSLRGFTTSWDVKWTAQTKTYKEYYISEWAIPMSSFRFKEGAKKWRFNSYQFDTQGNERNTWIQIPRNQFIFNLSYMGDMIFEKPLTKSKTPISIIPYVTGILGKDFENNEDIKDIKAGGDAKLSIGNSLNLDLTFNPDFSQVQADNLVTNLTRFEVNLPERRQFFIENSDLFGNFGNPGEANPFFSRRIGIASDSSGFNRQIDILAGARLSGKLTNDFRIGLLNVQTRKKDEFNIGANNHTVIALQHRVFERSNISAIFVNRQNTSNDDFIKSENEYNRVIGLDYNLGTLDNTWAGNAYFHKSFTPELNDKDISTGLRLDYNSFRWRLRGSGFYVGDNFKSDLGFIPRKGIFRIDPQIEHLIYPTNEKVVQHNISFTPVVIWKPTLDYKLTDYNFISSYNIEFTNTSRISARVFNRYTFLFSEFDPSRTGNTPLPALTDYHYTSGEINYTSDSRKMFFYELGSNYGEFFNGKKFTQEAKINLRLQPNYLLALEARYDKVNMPEPFANNDIWLLGSNFDITFSKSLFWATLIQYSNIGNNFGINSRLQWRFAPLSDIFLVYNDNYISNNSFEPRFRSINIKLNYWLYL